MQARTAPAAAAAPFPPNVGPKRRKTQSHANQARPMAIVQARTAPAAAAAPFPPNVGPKRRKKQFHESESAPDSDDSMSESETLKFDGTDSIMMLTASCVGKKRHMHDDSEPAPEGPPASAPAASAASPRWLLKARNARARAASEARARLCSFGDAGYLLPDGDRTNYDDNFMPKKVHERFWKVEADKFHVIHRVSQLYHGDVQGNKLFRSLVPIILPNLANLRFFNQNFQLVAYEKKRFIKAREKYEEQHWHDLRQTRMRFTHRSAINCKLVVDYAMWTGTEAEASAAHLEDMSAEAAAARPVPLNSSSSNSSNSSSSTMD